MSHRRKSRGGSKTFTRKKSSANRKAKTLRNKGCGASIRKLSQQMSKKHHGAKYVVTKGPCGGIKRR